MTIHISLPALMKGKNMTENITEGYDVSYDEAQKASSSRGYIKDQREDSEMEKRFQALENQLKIVEVGVETLTARLTPIMRGQFEGGTAKDSIMEESDKRSPMGRVLDGYINRLVTLTNDIQDITFRLEI